MQYSILNKRYRMESMIGSGGFGATYLATDIMLGMRVAVKEYQSRNYVLTEKEKQDFLKEARILAKFSGNEGIVDVRDFFQENGTVYIVMEYLEGVTLKTFLQKNGTMSVETAFAYMEPIMRILHEIHKAGIVHRDISPDNIMILKNKKMKLMDFGAARDFSNRDKTVSVILKPGYAPVEQYERINEQGPWTDVYALCATMYECITGVIPVNSLMRLRGDTVRRPSDMGADISSAFEQVLMDGLAVHREERIQSMDVLLARMQSALAAGRNAGNTDGSTRRSTDYTDSSTRRSIDADNGTRRSTNYTGNVQKSNKNSSKWIKAVLGILAGIFILTKAADAVRDTIIHKMAEEYQKTTDAGSTGAPDTKMTTESEKAEIKNVALFDLQPFRGEAGDILYKAESSDVDNMGNSYPYMIYCSNYLAEQNGPASVTYRLGGEYSNLNFTLGLRGAENDTSANGWLEFYSGDTMIAETTHFTGGVEPETFNIDVTGVDELTIKVGSDSDNWSISGYVFLMTNEFILTK